MTFEESLERLKERHEALTMSMELFTRETQDRFEKLLTASRQDGENIRALVRIAEIHERRLTHLEDGGDA